MELISEKAFNIKYKDIIEKRKFDGNSKNFTKNAIL
jgi:hypothetical protein